MTKTFTNQTINYCPVCGASAPSELTSNHGGDWHCKSCDKVIDSYILSKELLEDHDESPALTFSEEEKEILIAYCPVCRHHSEKPIFENTVAEHGGEWICEKCDEYIEAYVLPDYHKKNYEKNHSEENSHLCSSKMSILFILLIALIIAYFIFK